VKRRRHTAYHPPLAGLPPGSSPLPGGSAPGHRQPIAERECLRLPRTGIYWHRGTDEALRYTPLHRRVDAGVRSGHAFRTVPPDRDPLMRRLQLCLGQQCTILSQRLYHRLVDTDWTNVGPDPALKEAVRRLRERLAAAEEVEARARERAESLRIALREVEALAAPPPLSGVLAPSGTDRAMLRAATTASSQEGPSIWCRRDTSHGHTAADAIRNVLAENPRPWNAAEIISAISRTGALAGLRDPATAIRAALRRMVERGEVLRVGRGSYQAAGTTPRPVPTEEFDLGTSPVFGYPPEHTMDDQKEDEL